MTLPQKAEAMVDDTRGPVACCLRNTSGVLWDFKSIESRDEMERSAKNLRQQCVLLAEVAAASSSMSADVRELVEALKQCVDWYGKRTADGSDAFLPLEQQEEEIAAAMRLLAKHKDQQ